MVQQVKEKRKQYGGWTPKSFDEKKVQIWVSVKRKYFKEATIAVKEVLKQYR